MTIGNLIFQFELLVGEYVFLSACPKRKHFWARFAVAVAVCLACGYFFPMPESIQYNPYYSLLRFLVLFAFTVVGMGCCFDVKPFVLFSMCCSGYAVQHIGYHVYCLFMAAPWGEGATVFFNEYRQYLEPVFVFAVAPLAWWMFAKQIKRNALYEKYSLKLSVISVVMILICVGLTRVARYEHPEPLISISLYSIACCILALVVQYSIYEVITLTAEKAVLKRMREEDRRQYEMTKATIETINIKCHDLKHRLRLLEGKATEEEIRDLKDAVQFYDSTLKTSCSVLNLVVMDNLLRYHEQGIKFSFMGDGQDLNFMKEADLASLLGNAIGNAVEAAIKVPEEGKRTIGITVSKVGDLTTLVVRNYFVGELKIQNGYPVTTHAKHVSEHGFGLRSISRTANKYGGSCHFRTDGDIFILTVSFMSKD